MHNVNTELFYSRFCLWFKICFPQSQNWTMKPISLCPAQNQIFPLPTTPGITNLQESGTTRWCSPPASAVCPWSSTPGAAPASRRTASSCTSGTPRTRGRGTSSVLWWRVRTRTSSSNRSTIWSWPSSVARQTGRLMGWFCPAMKYSSPWKLPATMWRESPRIPTLDSNVWWLGMNVMMGERMVSRIWNTNLPW